MQRIRYTEFVAGVLRSKPLSTYGATVYVQIQLNNKSALIINVNTLDVIDSIETSSIPVLKQKIKKALIKLGAEFSDEIRGRKVHKPIGDVK